MQKVPRVVLVVLLVFFFAPATNAAERGVGESSREMDLSLKFTLPEHDLYPENIAYDAVSKDYFVGSMSQSRIIRIHEDGSYEDFASRPDSELVSSIGMKVDDKRRVLWVCSGRYTLFGRYDKAPARTGVLKFNLDDGALIDKWMLDQQSDYHIFNDVVLASNGDAYATTTLMGRVYRIPAGGKEMELVHQLGPGRHNNGIDLDDDEKYLFIVVDRTISRLELATGELITLDIPEQDALGSDGLYFYKNSLVTVKPRFKQILQILLNDDFTAAVRVDTLAQNHKGFAYPTTGVIVGDKLVFVATSYADVPRNTNTRNQHPDVLIYEVTLASE